MDLGVNGAAQTRERAGGSRWSVVVAVSCPATQLNKECVADICEAFAYDTVTFWV